MNAFQIRVLIIDDQKIIVEALRKILNSEKDIEFFFCLEPKKALSIIHEVKPTVILQDLVMPEISGLDLIKILKDDPFAKEIPLVVLSTKEEPEIKALAFSLGANDYLIKFPDRLELIARVRYHSNAYIRLLERNEAYEKIRESQEIVKAELAEAAKYVYSLLPAPLHSKIQVDWRFLPSTQLGGDAFGYYWLDERHFSFYLLDVCGHGVGAALLSTSILNALRSQTLPHTNFHDPTSVLSSLNASFQMENQNNMFFTIWYGVYDCLDRRLMYATGGHPPAVLLRKSPKAIESLKMPGLAIGVMEDAKFESGTCLIDVEDRLLLFSDGVYEIEKVNGEFYQLSELIAFLGRTADNAQFNLDSVIEEVQSVQQKKIFSDDFSFLQIIF